MRHGSKPVGIVGKGTLEQSVVHVPVMLYFLMASLAFCWASRASTISL